MPIPSARVRPPIAIVPPSSRSLHPRATLCGLHCTFARRRDLCFNVNIVVVVARVPLELCYTVPRAPFPPVREIARARLCIRGLSCTEIPRRGKKGSFRD